MNADKRTDRTTDRRLPAEIEGDHGNEGRGEDVDEVIAEQNQADDPVGSLQQALRQLGTAVPLAGLVAQLVTVEAHECCFRAREKGGKQQQGNKQAD